jgi:hypothetical protein
MNKLERTFMDALAGAWQTAATDAPNKERMVAVGRKNIEIYCREVWKLTGKLAYPLPLDRAVAVIQGRI